MTENPTPLVAHLSELRGRVVRVLARRRGLLLIAILGLLAFGATVVFLYPGFMSRDSGDQLHEARTGLVTDHHPVLMALIWRLADRIVPGPIGMLVLISGIYWAGLAGIFWGLPGPLIARAIGLLAVGFFPPSFNCVAAIWKDPFMHAVMLAGVACVVAPISRARWPRHLVALLLFVFAIGLRHNAAAAVWPLVILLLIDLPALVGRPRWLRLGLAGGASLVLTLALTVGLKQTLAPLARPEHFWQETPAFDLAGISLNAGTVVIDQDTGLLTPGMGLEEIRQQYRPDYQIHLYYCAVFVPDRCVFVFNRLDDPVRLSKLTRNWLRAVRKYPGAYLAHRSQMAARILRMGDLEKPRKFYYLDGRAPSSSGTGLPSARPYAATSRLAGPPADLGRLCAVDLRSRFLPASSGQLRVVSARRASASACLRSVGPIVPGQRSVDRRRSGYPLHRVDVALHPVRSDHDAPIQLASASGVGRTSGPRAERAHWRAPPSRSRPSWAAAHS